MLSAIACLQQLTGKQLQSWAFRTSAMSLNTTGTQGARSEPTVPPAVTGWLLFLCLLLTLVYPATTLYHILTHTLPSLISGHRPAFIFLLSVYCFFHSAGGV